MPIVLKSENTRKAKMEMDISNTKRERVVLAMKGVYDNRQGSMAFCEWINESLVNSKQRNDKFDMPAICARMRSISHSEQAGQPYHYSYSIRHFKKLRRLRFYLKILINRFLC